MSIQRKRVVRTAHTKKWRERTFSIEQVIGEEVARARKQAGMTQQELARHAKTRQANISRLERGIQNPSVEFLERVAKSLGRKIRVQIS
ncbi:MAG: helix-turn-helix transcriptional regulator [Candidatus Omnitrophota bacterium]